MLTLKYAFVAMFEVIVSHEKNILNHVGGAIRFLEVELRFLKINSNIPT